MPTKGPARRRRGGPVVAIVAAAGEGKRSGLHVAKQFLRVGGRTLLDHALARLCDHPEVDAIVAVIPESAMGAAPALAARHPKVAGVVAGGTRRQDSVARGLLAPAARTAAIVLVHDAARPLVPYEVISAVIREARRSGAAVPGLVPPDTVKIVDGRGRVMETPVRESVRLVQTPQAFRGAWIRRAFRLAEKNGFEATDDASMVEAAGLPVRVVEGAPRNFKVTTGDDVDRLRACLRRR